MLIAAGGCLRDRARTRNIVHWIISKRRPTRGARENKGIMYNVSQGKEYETAYVYFVLDQAAGMVKIGYTRQIEGRRFGGIYSPYGGALRLLGIMPGGAPEEAAIHALFAEERDGRREWFRMSDRLVEFITARAEWVDPICQVGQYQLDGVFLELRRTPYKPLFLNRLADFMTGRGLSVMDIAVKVGCYPRRIEAAMADPGLFDVQLFTAICHSYKAQPTELIRCIDNEYE